MHIGLEVVHHRIVKQILDFRWLCDFVIVALHMVLNLLLIAYGLEVHLRIYCFIYVLVSLLYICSRIVLQIMLIKITLYRLI